MTDEKPWGLQNNSGLSKQSAKQPEKAKHDPHIHMIHTSSGKVGSVPESRTAEALANGFEYAALLRHSDGHQKWFRHQDVKSALKSGYQHLYES